MKILLIDIDSKIPNLALMKISNYHKKKGDDIIFNFALSQHEVDKIYISVIFEKNMGKAQTMDLTGTAVIGGSGTKNYSIVLPEEIERTFPDYDLYNCGYSIGFTSRGCIRKCPFCIVPNKEGFLRPTADIYDIWDKRHKDIVLLDNNILGIKDHFFKIVEQIKFENLRVDFNQGLDFRLLDGEICKALKSIRKMGRIRFSFDNIQDTEKVITAIDMLNSNGLKSNFWYVLAGYNTTFEEDLHRLNILKKHNQRAYLMRYKNNKHLTSLARWVNQPNLFYKWSYEEFLNKANTN